MLGSHWNRDTRPPHAVEVFELPDACLVADGLIFDRDRQLIENVSEPRGDAAVAAALETVRRTERSGAPRHAAPGIVARRRGGGHILLEILPMALIGMMQADGRDAWFATAQAPPLTTDAMLRAFRLLGIPLARVMISPLQAPLRFDTLIVTRGLIAPDGALSPLALRGADWLMKAATTQGMRPDGRFERLFVARAADTGAALRNQSEVAQRLARRGFAVIEPNRLSLEEQMRVFASARHVVGVEGEAMTSIAFCQPGARITVLRPALSPDLVPWFIANHRKLDYEEVRGEQVCRDGPNSWTHGFALDAADIAYLETM